MKVGCAKWHGKGPPKGLQSEQAPAAVVSPPVTVTVAGEGAAAAPEVDTIWGPEVDTIRGASYL